MKLLIVRHAIAMDREDYQSAPAAGDLRKDGGRGVERKDDSLRPLTPEGIRKMRKQARGLAALGMKPSVLVTSPFTRTLQTAEILNEVWPALDIRECSALKPGSSPASLIKWLRENIDDEIDTVCLVGHEPHLTQFIGWLLTGHQQTLLVLKKGGACLLDFDALPARSAGQLLWHATPALLRAIR